jgi:hypothetical protein
MKRGKTPIEKFDINGSASDAVRVEPAAEELDSSIAAPQPASARAREFEWSLATYFGQSFVVFAYRAPDCG